jgi:tagatose-1,6-bisphosphate aldolase
MRSTASYLESQMEGKDKAEFSNFSLLENYKNQVKQKLQNFAVLLLIDFDPCLKKVSQQFEQLVGLSVTYYTII